MVITAVLVKELRERTNAGIMDCKKVLIETDGNIEKAMDLLKERGIASAAKKSSRIASEGLVESYIHNGKYGALVEVNSETDFVSKNDDFKEFVKDIAMHIAASGPKYVKREDVPVEIVEKEKSILKAQALSEGKPEAVVEKMIEGRINKYFAEICLLEQPFIKNPDITVQQLLTELIAKIGENIVIRRFARFERGEGIETKKEDFAEEVMKQINK
ncbi:MAG: translation elongation factor Ts [Clostridia bacterium]